jgi:hypothetical protein
MLEEYVNGSESAKNPTCEPMPCWKEESGTYRLQIKCAVMFEPGGFVDLPKWVRYGYIALHTSKHPQKQIYRPML